MKYRKNYSKTRFAVKRHLLTLISIAVLLVALITGGPWAQARRSQAATLMPTADPIRVVVNMTGDAPNISQSGCDVNPLITGDQCTLRAAIMANNSNPGPDRFAIRIPSTDPGCDANGNCTISVSGPLPTITDSVSIDGPGASKLRVQAAGSSNKNFTLLSINTTGEVNISGITIAKGVGSENFHANMTVGGGATLNIAGSVITDNYSFDWTSYGIAVGLATVNVTDSTISGNGIGVANDSGVVNLTRTTVRDNLTGINGGRMGGSLNLVNCTFAFNGSVLFPIGSPTDPNTTGPIYFQGPLMISNSTFAMNLMPVRHFGESAAVIKSSIAESIAPTARGAIEGTFTSGGYNVVGPIQGDFVATDTDRISPGKLGQLQNNGGFTETFALQSDSPAIDNGNSFGLTTDQRGTGYVRTADDPAVANAQGGDGTDSGAFEIQVDSDDDGLINPLDNCPSVANADQADNDGDILGDVCDPDDDNDGVADEQDAFPIDPNESADTDGDGIGNNTDTDDDNDGVLDTSDAFPLDATEWADADGDGIGNNADTDDDNDGSADTVDNCPLTANPDQADFDRDGIGDTCDSQTGPPVSKQQCKNGGWMRFDYPQTFANENECKKFLKGR